MKLKNKKQIFALFTALTMTITGTIGCSSDSKTSRPDSNMEFKMETTEAMLLNGQITMPWRTISFLSSRMYRNLFIANAGEIEVEPDLAESYSVSEDGLVYEIILKDKLLWSDGEVLDLDDVVFSIESFLLLAEAETVGNIFLTAFSDIIGYEEFIANPNNGLSGLEVDGNKITIVLNNPNNLFPAVLSQFVILPEHAFEGVDPINLFKTDLEYWDDPICSGMYKLGEHVEGEYIKLVYNENHNGSTDPYINSIMLRDDYEYEELDYYETNDVSLILDYRAMSNQTEYDANSIFYRYFVFNIDKGGEEDPVLGDIRVRQAFMHALDREEIVKNVYYGIGDINNTSAIQEYDNPIEFDYSYDPEKAKQLLEEAEYDFNRPVTLLYYYSDDISIKFMEECGKYLEAIGLTVDIFKGNLYNEASDYYDMGLKGLPVFSIEDWYNEYLSSSQFYQDIYGDYNGPAFDQLVIDLKQAKTVEERNEILAELQALEYELLYKMPVFIMGHKVYINNNIELPSGVEFGDSKYRYHLNFENWKVSAK